MKGQFGLTTLIIFIALIVTAAVAAGVIIYTTQTMQQQALQTGAQAKQRVSTGIEAARVLGYQYDTNASKLDASLQKITIVAPIIRLMSGSNPINFNDFTVLLTSERGKFISLSLKSDMPVAVHGKLEGGKVKITGFIYGNAVDVTDIPEYIITDDSICNTLNTNHTYIVANSSTAPCYLKLQNITDLLDIEEVLKLLSEMEDYGVLTPSLLLALTMRNQNIYLESGEIYEWLMLLPEALYPEEKYTIQIIPKGGYVTQIDGTIPTVLQAPVEDIWAK